MKDRNFEQIGTNGIILNTVVEGEGPLVILLHGWPQSWYLWRHLIDPLVEAGYRVAAPDQRGYGGSSVPPAVEDYTMREIVPDVAGIATALGEEEFVVVGHDWGCIVAWYTALTYPDRCRAVMGLSVPFWKFGPEIATPPVDDEGLWYIRYFIENPGRVEEEFEEDLERTLFGLHYSMSAEAGQMGFFGQLKVAPTGKLLEGFPVPNYMPGFMTQEDLDYYVSQYEKSGFRGILDWYRNMPQISETMADLQDQKITQPAAFLVGTEDPSLVFFPTWREPFEADFEDLRFAEMVRGAGHWLQLEQPEVVSAHVLRFLSELGAP